MLAEDYVARLLSSYGGAQPDHLFQHVLIAHRSTNHLDTAVGECALQPKIRHHGGHYDISGQPAFRFQRTPGSKQYAIAIDYVAGGGDEDGAIGIAIESDTEGGAAGNHLFLQGLQMERTAIQVDVAAVGLGTNGFDLGAGFSKKLGGQPVTGAVSAIDDQADAA